MPRLLLPVLAAGLLLSSAGAACNKSRQYMSGLALPSGLKPECGMLYSLFSKVVAKSAASDGYRIEVYRVISGFNKILPRVLADAAQQGYVLKNKDVVQDPLNISLAYSKPGHPLVIQIMELDNAVILAVLSK